VAGKINTVESAQLGKRDFTVKNGVASFELPVLWRIGAAGVAFGPQETAGPTISRHSPE
jgi:hypothetical protein